MTITNDDIKKAFAPLSDIAKSEPVQVDLEGVATGLITKTADFANSDNPLEKLADLEAEVDKIDHMLEHATSDQDGNVVVAGSAEACGTAKVFPHVDAATESPAEADKSEGTGTQAADLGEEEAHTEADKSGDGEEVEAEKDDDLSDDVQWEQDLSPAELPSGNGRLTKSERSVPRTSDRRPAGRGGRTLS